jgi:hypothetical protein
VKSQVTDDFMACFAKLPVEIRSLARKSYRLWRDNPGHPGLHFKRIHNQEAMYSVRVSKDYRALGLLDKDTMTWFWIGTHAEYDQLIK